LLKGVDYFFPVYGADCFPTAVAHSAPLTNPSVSIIGLMQYS
jgi:hypothetical protein